VLVCTEKIRKLLETHEILGVYTGAYETVECGIQALELPFHLAPNAFSQFFTGKCIALFPIGFLDLLIEGIAGSFPDRERFSLFPFRFRKNEWLSTLLFSSRAPIKQVKKDIVLIGDQHVCPWAAVEAKVEIQYRTMVVHAQAYNPVKGLLIDRFNLGTLQVSTTKLDKSLELCCLSHLVCTNGSLKFMESAERGSYLGV
jgi:hypothetical protein